MRSLMDRFVVSLAVKEMIKKNLVIPDPSTVNR